MKFTKVIRSFMEKTLSEKRYAANKADPETQAYINRKQHAVDEIRAIVDRARGKKPRKSSTAMVWTWKFAVMVKKKRLPSPSFSSTTSM